MTRFLGAGAQGVRPYVAGDLLVSANGTPNMTVLVAAGEALINGTQSSIYQGAYHCLNDASVSLSIAAADPTNPRIDLVVAQVRDAAYSGSNNDWILAVVTGTPAPSPSPPATPNNAIVLAQVAVAALASSITSGNITDKRPVFGLPFKAYAYANHNQTLSSGTLINVDTIDFDPNGNVNTTTHLYTCPVPGSYSLSFVLDMDTAGLLVASVRQAGSRSVTYIGSSAQTTGVNTPTSGGAALVKAAANDTLGLYCEYTSGGNVHNIGFVGRNYLAVQWTGP